MRIFAILFLALGCYSGALFAKPFPFEIVPTTTLPPAIVGDQKVVVGYRVTNTTNRILPDSGVVNLPTGMTQIIPNAPNACPSTFTLSPGSSCQLWLQIDADSFQGITSPTPEVCTTQANPTFCSVPTVVNQLVTKKVAASEVQHQKMVIMRHAEKPSPSQGQLSCQGLNRALELPQSLSTQFGKPDAIFATNPAGLDGGNSYVRPLMTIEPTAIQYDQTVATSMVFSNSFLMSAVLLSHDFRDSLVYVAWEHVQITPISQNIATSLGYDPDALGIPDSWPDDDYDGLYIFDIAWYKGIPALSFAQGAQGLDPGTLCPTTSEPFSGTPTTPSSTKIYFVQAGPSKDLNANMPGQMNCYGLNRGLDLINVFRDFSDVSSYFFASAPPLVEYYDSANLTYYNYLAQQVIEPVAIDQVQQLRSLFGFEDYTSMANYLLSSELQDTVITVAWDVQTLASLISKVCNAAAGGSGANCTPTITEGNIYLLDFNGGDPTITTISEGISPSSSCPYSIT